MKRRMLGTSGIEVSVVGLGCSALGGRLDASASRAVVHAALDAGLTFLDTADVYGERYGKCCASEESLGECLGPRRKDVVLATKFGNPRMDYGAGARGGASRRVIHLALEASLRRLRTDWIDLYQLHMPDPATPIEETLRALDDLVRSGKVRAVGCSNFSASRVVEAHWTARTRGLHPFVTCQNEYSLLVREVERDVLPAVERCGLGLLPYYPLAVGLLTGKHRRDAPSTADASVMRLADRFLTEARWAATERLAAFCADRGRSLRELAVSWLLAHPAVPSVIAGATRPEQIAANVAAAEWALDETDMREIDVLAGRP